MMQEKVSDAAGRHRVTQGFGQRPARGHERQRHLPQQRAQMLGHVGQTEIGHAWISR